MRKLLMVVLLFIFSLAKAQPTETSKEESWKKIIMLLQQKSMISSTPNWK